MRNSKADLGDIGELHVSNHLESLGYQLARYGKETRFLAPKLQHLELNHPMCNDTGVNCPIGNLPKELSEENAEALLNECKTTLPYGKHFLIINFAVNRYMKNCQEQHRNKHPMPYSGNDIKEAEKSSNKDEAERMKNENRAAIKSSKGAQPGRYDFIAYKDNVYSAVEVKVNSSKPTVWQKIRLGLILRYGGCAMIATVKITKEQIAACVSNQVCTYESLQLEDFNPEEIGDLPTDEDFLKTLNYETKHELWKKQNAADREACIKSLSI